MPTRRNALFRLGANNSTSAALPKQPTTRNTHRSLGRWAARLREWGQQASTTQGSSRTLPLPFLCAAGLILCIIGIVYGGQSLHHHLIVQKVLSSGIVDPPAGLVLSPQQHAADEMLLRQIVDECSKREDIVLQVDSSRRLVVSKEIEPG